MPDKRIKLTLLCVVLLSATAVCEYVLEDLIAMEDNQRAIHNIGDDSRDGVFNAAGEHRQLIRTVRQKKADNEGGEKQNEKEKPKENNDDDEEKKTLAQQVADGKYGLIQTEIFSDKPERPGIISYEINPEVPKDNVNNLGGLKAEEIWLAENHLLVLGGGGFGDGGGRDEGRRKPIWPPIDNYVAPERQVKIPPNPKVPPPFPVQLREGGPIEFLRGENGTGGPPPFPPFPGPGFFPPGNFSGPPGNFIPGNGAFPGQLPPFPFPPLPPGANFNGSFIPPPPQFLPPPGGVGNQSLPFDEDDPSIYYPPPYDFVYPRDNSSIVPAGPLVPGIVLPPPPDFFAPLNDKPAQRRPRPPPQKTTPTKSPPRPTKKPASEKYPSAIPARGGSTVSKPTKRPSVQIITEEPQNLNEVTPFPHSLPPNALVQGWLPIPAPRPFYITRPRKPQKNSQQENTTPAPEVIIKERRPTSSQIYSDDGYYYEKPKTRPKETVNYTPTKLVNVDNPYNPPQVYNNPIYITSTIPPPQVPYQNQPQPQNGKALKTFYFYEEPQDISTTTIRPPVQTNYYSTPVPHSNYYLPVQEQPRYVQNKYELPPLRAGTRAPPVNYFYITEAPPRAVTTSSRKPPIYEYSYTAPGYGTIDAPKVGTPTPLGISHASVNNQIPDDGSYNYYDDYLDQTTPRTPVSSKHHYNQDNLNLVKNNLIYTTERPVYRAPQTKSPPRGYVYSTTQRPILSTTAAPYSADHQTQNPYYAFFTHHDAGLIDDITKKYFTIFGQKLNNQGTTPLTPTQNSYESVTRKPVNYNRVVTSTPPPSRLQEYYTSTQSPRLQEYYYSSPAPQNVPAYYDYDYYDSVERINSNSQGGGQKAQYYDRSSAQSQTPRPPTLDHDTDVNYNTQNLQIDADAEVIDPQKVDPLRQRAEQLQLRHNPIGSSLISYSLPGNGGGHFYFLTPQSIQDEADANAYAAYSQQQQLGPLYYNKRNTQRQQRQQPISSSSSNSQSSTSTRNTRRQNKRRQYSRQNAEAT